MMKSCFINMVIEPSLFMKMWIPQMDVEGGHCGLACNSPIFLLTKCLAVIIIGCANQEFSFFGNT